MHHYVKNLPLDQNFSKATNEIVVGAGCFWGVEKKFWDLPGVLMTSVGYSGGETDNPTYEDVCYKNTNHVEVVKESKFTLKLFYKHTQYDYSPDSMKDQLEYGVEDCNCKNYLITKLNGELSYIMDYEYYPKYR